MGKTIKARFSRGVIEPMEEIDIAKEGNLLLP